jgi:hypothetical protein
MIHFGRIMMEDKSKSRCLIKELQIQKNMSRKLNKTYVQRVENVSNAEDTPTHNGLLCIVHKNSQILLTLCKQIAHIYISVH